MSRLSLKTLAGLPSDIARPAYDVTRTTIGIVHLGIGAFHRAHQAVYVDDRLGAGERGWGILGASLRSPDTRDALDPQDGLYTTLVRSGAGDVPRVIGSVRKLMVAPENPEALLSAMSAPATRIVSLTVTEKGYCHDPATGELKPDHPDIVHDLAFPAEPSSAPGFLVEALRRRRDAGGSPFTVLCCDNLPANGATVRRVVVGLARRRDPDLADWIAGEVAFPSTMVDRIVPATTDADRDAVRARLGVEDAWPVSAEPFTQWVIEDHFSASRPRFEEAGAELVTDVAPYELMKLRLLNGAHSTMAYLGYLAGYETIAETIADTHMARLIREMWDLEIRPTLAVPPGADLDSYTASLLARFANPALRHRTWQIAMDGSQKLPQRLLNTIRERLALGAPFPRLALGVAAWMRYVSGTDEKGRPIDVRDPLAARFKAVAVEAGPSPRRLGEGLLAIREVFGADLPADPRFRDAVLSALEGLFADGAARTVAQMAQG